MFNFKCTSNNKLIWVPFKCTMLHSACCASPCVYAVLNEGENGAFHGEMLTIWYTTILHIVFEVCTTPGAVFSALVFNVPYKLLELRNCAACHHISGYISILFEQITIDMPRLCYTPLSHALLPANVLRLLLDV